jgi:hypothetical protein
MTQEELDQLCLELEPTLGFDPWATCIPQPGTDTAETHAF